MQTCPRFFLKSPLEPPENLSRPLLKTRNSCDVVAVVRFCICWASQQYLSPCKEEGKMLLLQIWCQHLLTSAHISKPGCWHLLEPFKGLSTLSHCSISLSGLVFLKANLFFCSLQNVFLCDTWLLSWEIRNLKRLGMWQSSNSTAFEYWPFLDYSIFVE